MKKPRLKATITEDFDLKFSIPRMLKMVLQSIGAGVDVHVEVKKWYKKRTNKQNATQWGLDLEKIQLFIFDNTGQIFSKEEIHHKHKEDFLGFEECKIVPGLRKVKSTKDLDTKEMADFRENYCRMWATMGLYLPDPDPDYKTAERHKQGEEQ